MISVESMSPMTMSVVWDGRREMLRSPMRASSGWRIAMKASTARAPASSTSRPMRMLVSGMPKRLSIDALLALDEPVAHVDDPVAAGRDARVVGHDHEGLLLRPVQLLHQAHDTVR